MIEQHYPTLRKGIMSSIFPSRGGGHQQPIPLPGPRTMGRTPDTRDQNKADQFKITPVEFVRRDDIVRQAFLDCPWRPGEVLRPKNKADYLAYGPVTVRGVLKSYHDFHANDKWPDDDEPYIITVDSLNGTKRTTVFCTSGWLTKENACQ